MIIEYDNEKNNKNIRERKLSFDTASKLNWNSAIIIQDERNDYPEKRFVATAYIENRLHVLCFSVLKEGIRVISFRKANKREVKRYEKATIN